MRASQVRRRAWTQVVSRVPPRTRACLTVRACAPAHQPRACIGLLNTTHCTPPAVPRCSSDAQCPHNQACNQGYCVVSVPSCVQGPACMHTRACCGLSRQRPLAGPLAPQVKGLLRISAVVAGVQPYCMPNPHAQLTTPPPPPRRPAVPLREPPLSQPAVRPRLWGPQLRRLPLVCLLHGRPPPHAAAALQHLPRLDRHDRAGRRQAPQRLPLPGERPRLRPLELHRPPALHRLPGRLRLQDLAHPPVQLRHRLPSRAQVRPQRGQQQVLCHEPAVGCYRRSHLPHRRGRQPGRDPRDAQQALHLWLPLDVLRRRPQRPERKLQPGERSGGLWPLCARGRLVYGLRACSVQHSLWDWVSQLPNSARHRLPPPTPLPAPGLITNHAPTDSPWQWGVAFAPRTGSDPKRYACYNMACKGLTIGKEGSSYTFWMTDYEDWSKIAGNVRIWWGGAANARDHGRRLWHHPPCHQREARRRRVLRHRHFLLPPERRLHRLHHHHEPRVHLLGWSPSPLPASRRAWPSRAGTTLQSTAVPVAAIAARACCVASHSPQRLGPASPLRNKVWWP